MNKAYSRLSTTHGHITDCELVCPIDLGLGLNVIEVVAGTVVWTTSSLICVSRIYSLAVWNHTMKRMNHTHVGEHTFRQSNTNF